MNKTLTVDMAEAFETKEALQQLMDVVYQQKLKTRVRDIRYILDDFERKLLRAITLLKDAHEPLPERIDNADRKPFSIVNCKHCGFPNVFKENSIVKCNGCGKSF